MFHARWVVFGYALALSAWTGVGAAAAPVGTAFTYQGQLKQDGAPENGNFDMEFRLFDAATLGNQIGNPVTLNGVAVSNGLFTVILNDTGQFGSNAFNGEARWLQITVGGTPLSPRQKLTLTPYAARSLAPWLTSGTDISYSGGKVGIGTSNPNAPLELVASNELAAVIRRVDVADTTTVDLLDLRASTTGTPQPGFGGSLTWRLLASNGASASVGTIDAVWVDPNIATLKADMLFKTRGGGNVFERMRITNNGNVGIGDASPAATLTVGEGDKFQVSGTQGDVTFTDDLASITFPATDATNAPMIYMFASGTTNGNRMVLAHSLLFPTWGLQYEDTSDKFHFLRSGTEVMTVDLGGSRVGIGTTAPGYLLDVGGRMRVREGSATAGIWFYQTTPAADRAFVGMYDDDTVGLYGGTGASWILLMDTTTGNVGIDTAAPEARLHIINGTDSEPVGGGFLVIGGTTSTNISIDNNEIMARNNGAVSTLYLNNGGGNVVIAPGATTTVSVLAITGADLAEKFPVSEKVEPGMVMEIDPDKPGQLRLARGVYNRRVAGVVSGANGLSAGAILGNLPGSENSPPIALSGRVWVHCDTSNGAIEPGDLLTTSDAPGHAMKVTDFSRAQGAIIGKAITGLEIGGAGLVLVLVSLQ